MFRWRSERNKVKAVFKLQFYVTQIVQSGVDALVLSIVPGDIGKVTTRLEKAAICGGVCRWESPVYETVKFVQEPKTGKFSERKYHFVVSTGLSKANSFGEVSIDFAEYAEATKLSTVSLPIKNSHCDAVLHVSIHRLQENNDKREEEQCEDDKLKSHDRSLRTYLSNGDIDASTKSDSSEDVSAKVKTNGAELNTDCRTSSGSDITLSSSDGSSGLDTPRELGLNGSIHPNNNGFLSDVSHTSEPQKPAVDASASIYDVHQRSPWDWSAGSEHGLSTDGSANGSQDALPRERSNQTSDMEIERLKAEVAALARQVDVSDLELQTLRKQIIKESKRGQDLSKEIVSLKEERDTLKIECENLRSFHKRMEEAKARNRSHLESGDLRTLVEEIRQELKYEKDLNANLQLQLKKTQESNAELVLAVQDLDEMLEQKNREICGLSNKNEESKKSRELGRNLSNCETDDDEEQKELEELVKEHSNAKDTYLLEQKIIDLYGEIEMYRRDKDELEMQMEQLALDYEILKQENHDIAYKLEQSQLQEQLKLQYECSSPPAVDDLETHIRSLENQLKEQSEEFSNSLATTKALETEISRLEEEMEKQAQGFEADLDAVTRDKIEQEQRAIRAEEALRNTRVKNANTAERLQEEFRRLSMQMASTFDANEKATMRALTEASELRVQKRLCEEMLHKVKDELRSVKADYEVKLTEISNKIDMMSAQKQQILLEIEDKSKQLENQKKHEEQVSRDFSEEIQMLKAENEKLKVDISCFSEQLEQKEILRNDLKLTKKSLEESENCLHNRMVERNELVSTIALLKKEAERSLNELNRMKHLKDEEETAGRLLHLELEALRAQYSDLKCSLTEDETEKERLRKQVSQLNGELRKKDEALINIEKRFKDSNGRTQLSDGTKTNLTNKKGVSIPQNSKEMSNLREKIKMLEGLIKSKETALETSTSSFSEKERELQSKIEELENKVEEFNQSIALQKVENLNDTTHMSQENGAAVSLFKSDVYSLEKEAEISTKDDNLCDILTELSMLKEKNNSMETELKEIQQRYSEMSLKFAEVEGERQKLVMTVRNLKNNRRGQ
ncbi:putative leucine-rich repeat-containing protein DDB_G0290503 [Abrus precatorius]|uniref:Leucine-rich repeat-containing protein DDB_G0290503 n=1 Tax=Abrus precatorius TaxID=3816 RepID=A0A8B8KEN3_ABRPR|nr:putative leucine-rich repeat-containing protein DDB_G0290503 [Abrus precatorius]